MVMIMMMMMVIYHVAPNASCFSVVHLGRDKTEILNVYFARGWQEMWGEAVKHLLMVNLWESLEETTFVSGPKGHG